MSTIDKVGAVFDILSTREALTATQVAILLDIPKPSAYRLLTSLTDQRLLEKDVHTKRYRLGWKIARLATNILDESSERYNLRQLIPFMQKLVDEIGETVTMSTLYGNTVVCIAMLEGNYSLRYYSAVGVEYPLNAAAPAKVLMAWQPQEVRNEVLAAVKFKAYTKFTNCDMDKYLEELKRVRKQGYAVCAREIEDECFAVSAPVFDSNGEIMTAISVVGLAARIEENMNKVQQCVMNTAADCSALWRPIIAVNTSG